MIYGGADIVSVFCVNCASTSTKQKCHRYDFISQSFYSTVVAKTFITIQLKCNNSAPLINFNKVNVFVPVQLKAVCRRKGLSERDYQYLDF